MPGNRLWQTMARWPRLAVVGATVLAIALALAGCAGGNGDGPTPAVTPPPAGATQPAPTATAIPGQSGTVILSWWTPEFMSPAASGNAGALMDRYVHEFEDSQAGRVRLMPLVKARYGKGGLLDLLKTAQPVAPGVLPDLVTIDISELEPAIAAGVLQPIDELLPEELENRLYPFAQEAGRFNQHLYAVPVVADIEQVVYDRNRIKSLPASWSEMGAADLTYVFPIAPPPTATSAGPARNVQRTLVSHYLSAGGTFDVDKRTVMLEEAPLARVLSFYSQARNFALMPASLLKTSTLEECWTAYSEGTVAMADVSARQYLLSREALSNAGYGPLPGWHGAARPVAAGWAVAIVTQDPARQQVAAEWLAWLLDSGRLGAWSQAAAWLPSEPAAWDAWGSNAYYDFLKTQLAAAVAPPDATSEQTAAALQKAVAAVLNDGANPNDAAHAAAGEQK